MKANSNKVLTEQDQNEMIENVETKFKEIFDIMGFDSQDQQIVDTPKRMSKMWIKELFRGCYTQEPKITVFDNTEKCHDMVFVGPISLKSTCSHHFVPFIGNVYIAYIPNEKIVGVSKLARITKWFMRRPQIQEELTKQIIEYIEDNLSPLGTAVYVEGQHLCMTIRGVEEYDSMMKTCAVRGVFEINGDTKKEFFDMVKK